MIIGTCTIYLSIPSAHSLKDKRRILKSVIARVRNKFNVSIAEVADNDYWQSATLGVACVANGQKHVHRTLAAVVTYIEQTRLDVSLVDYEIEMC